MQRNKRTISRPILIYDRARTRPGEAFFIWGLVENKSLLLLQDSSLITANYGVPKSEQGKTEQFRRNLRNRSINEAYEAIKAILGE